MKINFYLVLLLMSCFSVNAQFGSKQMISEAGGAEVYTFDIDGDNDLDILLNGNNYTSWFENVDGLGNFSLQQTIYYHEGISSTYASDIDGDGDLDIIIAELFWSKPIDISKITWFENLDGEGNFGTEQIIEYSYDFFIVRSIFSADIDGDGDMDILTGSHGDLFWYQNLDGLGNFGERQIITTNIAIVREVYAGDIDGDGDMDVVASSIQDKNITWYENLDGLGNFGDQQFIANNIGEAWSIYISDLNGDGNNDVLAAYWDTGDLSWFENLDGLGDFGSQQIISNNTQGGSKVYAEDIDGDGDVDVLSASTYPPSGIFAWYENIDGEGVFGNQQIIHQEDNFGTTLYAGDIDNDGDVDVVASSATVGLAWFENLLILPINDNNEQNLVFYPNPTNDILQIKNGQNIVSIKVYDIQGKLLLKEEENFNRLDISEIENGILIVIINTTDGVNSLKIIKE